MRKRIVILSSIIIAILLLVAIIGNFNLPVRSLKVLSGSMEPMIKAGDLIIIKETKDFELGDIVTYHVGRSYVTHRIREIDGDNIITKGDNNNIEDDPISKKDIEGEVIFIIPAFYYIWLKILGVVAIISLAITLLI